MAIRGDEEAIEKKSSSSSSLFRPQINYSKNALYLSFRSTKYF